MGFIYLNYSFWLVIISFITFLGYTVWVIVNLKGLPISYSDTYYRIKEKLPQWGFMFPAYCVIASFFLMVPLVYLSGRNDLLQVFMLLIGIGLPLVGASADHKSSKNEHWVHIIGVGLSAIGLIVWALIYFIKYIGRDYSCFYLLIIGTLIIFLLWGLCNREKKTFIWELGGFLIAYEVIATVLYFEHHPLVISSF